MSIARSVAEVLREHVELEVEAIDRMYLNVYVKHLQSVGAVVGYLRVHRGQRFASTAEPVVIDYETFSKIHGCHDRQTFAKLFRDGRGRGVPEVWR